MIWKKSVWDAKTKGSMGVPPVLTLISVSNAGGFFQAVPRGHVKVLPKAGVVPWTFGRLETPPLQKSKSVQFQYQTAMSNRSRFMTLVHAATKSFTNFASESAVA